MITNALTGFTQPPDKLEFARRAGGQVVTNVVCNRFHPNPLGIVLWRYKSEFIEFPVIANQSADWCGNPPDRRTTFRE